jgi:hypothetical protein
MIIGDVEMAKGGKAKDVVKAGLKKLFVTKHPRASSLSWCAHLKSGP